MSIRCGRVLLLAAVVSLGLSRPAGAQPLWWESHGLSWNELKAWKDREAKDYRVAYLNGFNTGGEVRYVAVVVRNEENKKWAWYLGSPGYLREREAELKAEGSRPICVTGYLKGRSLECAVVWVNDGRPVREKIEYNLTEKEYADRLQHYKMHHYMPSVVSGYADGEGSYRFTVLFAPAGRTVWEPHHDLTEEQYQKAIRDSRSRGFRPISITAYPTPAGLRFAAVFIKDRAAWLPQHGISSDKSQAEFDKEKKSGYFPISITGYLAGNPAGPELFDQTMRKFMSERDIKVGTLAVSRNGKELPARGYGIEADAPMRLASVTKPITAAAIRKLIREGKLSLDERAFPLLGLKPPPGQQPDPRLDKITIRHLLEHKGGWDREKSFDPMFRPLEIAAALKAPAPAGPVDIIRYMMGKPLQFDPGSKESYSNFGYCVLGRVIEKVSGQTYAEYIQKTICAPLGANSVALGRSLPKYRNPREPVYRHPGKGRNVLDPKRKAEVPAPDGTFYLEAMDSHGGLIASARDVLRFLDLYDISGELRQGNGKPQVFFGQLPGTFTMAMKRSNGINIVALFNQDTDPSGRDYFALQDLMGEAADRQSSGELRYDAVWLKSK